MENSEHCTVWKHQFQFTGLQLSLEGRVQTTAIETGVTLGGRDFIFREEKLLREKNPGSIERESFSSSC